MIKLPLLTYSDHKVTFTNLSSEGQVCSNMFYRRNRKMPLFSKSYFELYRELFLYNRVSLLLCHYQ